MRPLALFTLLALLGGAADAEDRLVPRLPSPDERIRLLIDTDAACEIDDLYALALAVTSPDRFDIEGLVAAHFGDAGGPEGIRRSYEAIEAVLERAGLAGRFPVKLGAPPFQYSVVAPEAEGVDFIIERALASDRDMRYIPTRENGRIRRVYQIDRDRTFDLFFGRLADWAQRGEGEPPLTPRGGG